MKKDVWEMRISAHTKKKYLTYIIKERIKFACLRGVSNISPTNIEKNKLKHTEKKITYITKRGLNLFVEVEFQIYHALI